MTRTLEHIILTLIMGALVYIGASYLGNVIGNSLEVSAERIGR